MIRTIRLLLLLLALTPPVWVYADEKNTQVDEAFAALQATMDAPAETGSGTGDRDPLPKSGNEKENPMAGMLARVMGVLLFILGMIWLAGTFAGRHLNRRRSIPGSGIRVLSRTALGNKSRIYLLEIGGTCLVVGEAGGSLRTLHAFASEEQPLTEETIAASEGEAEKTFESSLEAGRGELDRAEFLQRLTAGVRGLRGRKSELP